MNKSDSHRDIYHGSYREKSWVEIYETLKAREKTLDAETLYQLALAAYLTGRDEESIDLLSRSHHMYETEGKTGLAVKCAFWIGMLLMSKGEKARGSGWFSKAQRLLEENPDEEVGNGLLLIPAGLGSLSAGNSDVAFTYFQKAHVAGTKHKDPDLMTMSLLGQGQAMIRQGKLNEGIKLLDESMVSVESTDISPIVVGIVYCAVIETCQMIFDIQRAQEWTSVLSRWCESQPDLVPFRGQCLIRRSQIMHIHGEWPEALDEMKRACEILSEPPGEPAAGEACYQLAEIFRLRGNFEQAEKGYAEANQWSRKPQPGFALLRLALNERELAGKSIQSALDEAKTPLQRIKILPAYIEIMLANDRITAARSAADELSAVTEQYDSMFLQAMTAYCQGAVLLKEDAPGLAIQALQRSLRLWNELNAPYEIASVRLLLGLAYREKGDQDSAVMELSAAKWIFKELEALPDIKKVEKLIAEKQSPDLHGLTLRELQVLRLVAEGDTNKAIAGKLFISERTAERHLSNIFNKLNVNSRTEATTFAYKHNIL